MKTATYDDDKLSGHERGPEDPLGRDADGRIGLELVPNFENKYAYAHQEREDAAQSRLCRVKK
jgi:hypothetical protein